MTPLFIILSALIYIGGALITAIIIRIIDRCVGVEDNDDGTFILIAIWFIALPVIIIEWTGYGIIKGCENLSKKIIPDKNKG